MHIFTCRKTRQIKIRQGKNHQYPDLTLFYVLSLWSLIEQFNKLKQSHADDILSAFDDKDIKGMYDVRTFIAHDYEGVNLAIVEWIIRNGLPKFKEQCNNLVNKE